MAVGVTVQDDGTLVATCDGIQGPALTIEAVQALAARVADAENARSRAGLTAAVRTLTDVLLATPDTLNATVTITGGSLTAVLDPDSYTRVQAALGATPDQDGTITAGPLTVTPQPS